MCACVLNGLLVDVQRASKIRKEISVKYSNNLKLNFKGTHHVNINVALPVAASHIKSAPTETTGLVECTR